jgi:orotidine-5'-phosphate decarboxylase
VRAKFLDLLLAQWEARKYVCVGLDVDASKLPPHLKGDPATQCFAFMRDIVDATSDTAAAYKPNSAFFEALGGQGPFVLHELIAHIHRVAPSVPVIVDAKRADIANSNAGTVAFLFEFLEADAATVHPYLGHEALRPFLDQAGKGIFVLCRTSNPGAGELQDLEVGGEPLFLHLANLVGSAWNYNGNCGLVVGATYPNELSTIRARVPTLPLLIPGVGAQGGDLESTVRAAYGPSGLRVLINASRSIIYASPDQDFASAAHAVAKEINDSIAAIVANLE